MVFGIWMVNMKKGMPIKGKSTKMEKEKIKINSYLDGIMAVEKPKLTVILGNLCM